MTHPTWCEQARCTTTRTGGHHKGVVHTVEDSTGREILRWFLQAANGTRAGLLLAASPAGLLDDVAAARFAAGAQEMVRTLAEAQAQP